MGVSQSFDLTRITNLENRLDVDESVMVTNDDTTQQTVKNLNAPTLTATTVNVTGLNNSLVQTTGVANTQWIGGMEDVYTYYWTLGKFHANTRDIELRSYADNLIFRSGRKAGAAAGGISLITNDALTAGINSDITITCNTGGQVRANCAFNGSAFNVTSDESYKDTIEEFKDSALDLVKKTKVKKYHLKDIDKETDPKRIGLIRNEAPEQIQANDEQIDLYQMTSLLWKAVSELADKVSTLIPQVEDKK